MRMIFLLLLLPLYLYSDVKMELLSLYKEKQYKKLCLKASNSVYTHLKDEQFLSLLGFSCLKSGYIDRLILPIANLKSTPEARSNAAYFSVILMQKKLLLHSLVDKYKLTNITLPTTDTLLSKLFDLYLQNQDFTKDSYTFIDTKDKDITYKLYLDKTTKIKKMIIEKYYKNNREEQYIYW
jgi:hypothetical protein